MLIFAAYCALAAFVLFLPGAVIAYLGGARGLFAVALAPAVSITVISVGAIVLDKLHIPYDARSIGVLAAVVAAAVGGLTGGLRLLRPGWFDRGGQRMPRREWAWLAAAFAAAALLSLRYLHNIIPRSDLVAQGYDNVFHANAVQWMVQHHDASSLVVESMTSGNRPPAFYPAAWHGYVATILSVLPHTDTTIAINAATYVEYLLVWPVGLLLLIRTLHPFSRRALCAVPMLALSFPAFPLKPMSWGPLFPNSLAMVLTPALLALLIAATGVGRGHLRVGVFPAALLSLITLPGIALAHPSEIPVILVFLLPMLWLWWRSARHDPDLGRGAAQARLALLTVVALGTLVIWIKVRPTFDLWPAVSPRNQDLAIVSWLDMAGATPQTPALLVGALVVIGCFAWLRRPGLRWWVGVHLFWSALFMLNFVTDRTRWRYWLTGIWYCDHVRLAALLVLSAIPLAAQGLISLLKFIDPWWRRLVDGDRLARLGSRTQRQLRTPAAARAATVVVVLALTAAAYQSGGFRLNARDAMLMYDTSSNGELLDDYERQMLRDLPQFVPADETIATNPWNGSSMAYAVTGIPTTTTHVLYDPTPDVQLLNQRLYRADYDPTVCPVIRRLNVHWALDFGTREINKGSNPQPGFQHLKDSPGFVVAHRIGPAALYRIDACWSRPS